MTSGDRAVSLVTSWKRAGIHVYKQTSTEVHLFKDVVIKRYVVQDLRFSGSDYEEWHLLGCYAVWLL
jgi:hypothetical protein